MTTSRLAPSLGSRAAAALTDLFKLSKQLSTPERALTALSKQALRPASYGPPKRMKHDVVIDVSYVDAWPVYSISPSGKTPEKTLIYVHGGGFMLEMVPLTWRWTARIAVETATRVVVPIYPLLPQGNAEGVASTMLKIALRELADVGSENLSIAGESAGGQIALVTALLLRDQGHQFRKTILLSPAVDLSAANPELLEVEKTDPVLKLAGLRPLMKMWSGDLDTLDPRVSPLYGDMHGLGPMAIDSGTRDLTNPDTRKLVAKALAAGVAVDYREGEGLIHFSAMLPTKEGRATRQWVMDTLR